MPVVYYGASANRAVPSSFTLMSGEDKLLFSDAVEEIKGERLALVIHSPGGLVETVEAIVGLLRPRFAEVLSIVPDYAMSAATLLALAGDRIAMDERSAIGPIDPQVMVTVVPPRGGEPTREFVPAQSILEGFSKARRAIQRGGASSLPAYLPLLDKYSLHQFEICRNATSLSQSLAEDWLAKYMFSSLTRRSARAKARRIARELVAHKKHLSHGRPIGVDKAHDLGLTILDTRDEPKLRDAIWELHCTASLWFEKTPVCYKLCMNSDGLFLMKLHGVQIAQAQPQEPKQER